MGVSRLANCKYCYATVDASKAKLLSHLSECRHYSGMEPSVVLGIIASLRANTISYGSYFTGIKGKLEPPGEFEFVDFSTNGELKRKIVEKVCDPNFRNVTRVSTIQKLKNLLYEDGKLKDFNAGFWERVPMNANVIDEKVYYRVMSDAEKEHVNTKDPFKAAFDYKDGATYIYWMSSSLAKVKAFGNENVTDAARNYGKFTFSSSPILSISVAPSQDSDSACPEKLYMHQEGFAELGMFNSTEYVTDVTKRNLSHNIGLTKKLHNDMKKLLLNFEFII